MHPVHSFFLNFKLTLFFLQKKPKLNDLLIFRSSHGTMDIPNVFFQIMSSGAHNMTDGTLCTSGMHVTMLYKTDRVSECFETCSTHIIASFFAIY